MKELLKNQYKNVILVCVYTILAGAVYCMWAHSLWGLWYIDMIIGLVILAIGAVVGYFYISSEDKNEQKAKAKIQEPTSEIEAKVEENSLEEEKKPIENEQ